MMKSLGSAAQEEIRKRGGNVADSVSKQVDLVVVGEDAGSKLEKTKKHTIEIVVDRIVIRPGQETRLTDSVELALANSDGIIGRV